MFLLCEAVVVLYLVIFCCAPFAVLSDVLCAEVLCGLSHVGR